MEGPEQGINVASFIFDIGLPLMGIPLSKYSIMAKAIGCLDDDLPATCKGRGLGYSCLITGTLNWVKANVKRQRVVLI